MLILDIHYRYMYDSEEKGIKVHADQANVNLNFWITPDSANMDPKSGGFIVYKRAPPEAWTFADYNYFGSEGEIVAHVAGGGQVVVRSSYSNRTTRCSRTCPAQTCSFPCMCRP